MVDRGIIKMYKAHDLQDMDDPIPGLLQLGCSPSLASHCFYI